MGRGRSGLSNKYGSNRTPSGIDYKTFMSMSDVDKYDTMANIIKDKSIVVPDYLDRSPTSKVMYALGLSNKPNVVSDEQLDGMSGEEIFRTVYDPENPPPYAKDILDQIRNGDFTQMSGAGGSLYGRALYFADNYESSAIYGAGEENPMMMRAKIDPKANLVDVYELDGRMKNDRNFLNDGTTKIGVNQLTDGKALYALAHGIDGWFSEESGYNMIINRSVLRVSSKNKSISASSWREAEDV